MEVCDNGASDYSPDFVDQLIMDSDSEGEDIREKCAICSSEVPVKEMSEHVKGHGFGEEEYRDLSSKITEGSEDNKIIDSCRFRCKYLPCDHEATSWREMTGHIYLTHNLRKRHDPVELVVERKDYKCPKCQKLILQDRSIIKGHMQMNHVGKKPKRDDKPAEETNADIENPDEPSNSKEAGSTEDQMSNGCTFACKYCEFESNAWRQMTAHLTKVHNNSKRQDPYSLVVYKQEFKCQRCPKVLLQDRGIIYKHMQKAHVLIYDVSVE